MLFEKFCQSQVVLILFLFFFIVNLGCTEESPLPERGVCAHHGANGTISPQKLNELFEVGVEFPLVDELEAMLRAAEKLGIQPLKSSNSFTVSEIQL